MKRSAIIARARTLRRKETDAELLLWTELANRRLNGFKFVRQFPVPPFIVDFACRSKRLIIELDGAQHAQSQRDLKRTGLLNVSGWSVLRFWNDEVFKERNAVLETILAVLEGRLRHRSDGDGWIDGLRFAPARLSHASLRAGLSSLSEEEEGLAGGFEHGLHDRERCG